MKASEARELVQSSVPTTDAWRWLNRIYEFIKKHAKEGKSSMPMHAATRVRGPGPNFEELSQIKTVLRAEGFEVIEHSDPGTGDPREFAWTEIRW